MFFLPLGFVISIHVPFQSQGPRQEPGPHGGPCNYSTLVLCAEPQPLVPTSPDLISTHLTRSSTLSSHVELNSSPAATKYTLLPGTPRAVFNRHRCCPTSYLSLLIGIPGKPAIFKDVSHLPLREKAKKNLIN